MSDTLLAGKNLGVAASLVSTKYKLDSRPCWYLLAEYYEGEFYPVSMYDRGIWKTRWLQDSPAAQNHQSYRMTINLDSWTAWVWIGAPTMFFTLFPSIMAYSMANQLPFPKQGCCTFAYQCCAGCQILLVLLAMQRNNMRKSLFSLPSKSAQNVFYSCVITLTILLAFAISLLGSVFQIFGVFYNCFCQTLASKWTFPPSERQTVLRGFYVADQFEANDRAFAQGVIWAAAGVTRVLCFLGF